MKKEFVELSEGKRLSYRVYGEGAHTVLLLHGLVGGSWLGDAWVSAITENDVRCIVPDRPGYGHSSDLELVSVAEWMPIVRTLAQTLSIASADVIGCSAGGPYAYATALALPDRIGRVFVLDGVPAVYEEAVFRHYSEENRAAYQSFVIRPQQEIREYYMGQMEAARQRLAGAGPAYEYVLRTIEEAMERRCFGMAQESRLQRLPWGLPLDRITQPVVLYHAREDEMVPYEGAREMLSLVANCELHDVDASELPAGGSPHMSAISHSFCKLMSAFGPR